VELSRYACEAPERLAPPPGAVGLDKRATCPKCGRRVAVTARGRYARHRRPEDPSVIRFQKLLAKNEAAKPFLDKLKELVAEHSKKA
jgi:hypothetical protein